MKELEIHIEDSKTQDAYLLTSVREVENYFNATKKGSLMIFDWETTGLEYDCIPLGLSLNNGRYSVFCALDYFFTNGIPKDEFIALCNKWFPNFKLAAHNAKFDSMVSIMQGIKDENIPLRYDTLVMVHLVDPTLDKQLEKRVKIDFGYEKKTFEEISGKKWHKINWASEGDSLLELLATYACEDTYWERKVFDYYSHLMDEDAWKIHDRIELPMVNILRDAKIRGVLIDVPLLKEMGKRAQEQLEVAEDEIYEIAGCVFNLNSPKQKQDVFFNKMKLPIISTTKTGQPSTDSGSAEEWAEMGYPIGEALVKFSELQKLLSGYLNAIPNLVDSENVLRGDLNSCGTRTGRMASSNPNLQNQPNNHDFPVRAAFIPRPGYVFVNYDYSQLELRVMAHLSGDKKFTDIFMHGGDPHGDVAKRVGISRKQAKVLNFGVLYGMGPDKYSRTFGVTIKEAKAMVDEYHRVYEGFAQWKTYTENFAKKYGYVKNLFGRKRILSEAAKNPYQVDFDKKRYFGELRQAVNTSVQGTGADIVKLATIAMCKRFKELDLDAHFLLQVHDEVLIEARRDQMLEVEKVVIDCMENTIHLDIPLKADGKILMNWGEMKDDDILSLPLRMDYSLLSGIL